MNSTVAKNLILTTLLFSPLTEAQSGAFLAPSPQTIALYHLDSQSQNAVLDIGPNALQGTLQGNATLTNSYLGKAIQFDGSLGSFLKIDDPKAKLVPTNNPFTIEAWVKLDKIDGFTPIPILSRQSLPLAPPAATGSAFELCYHPMPGGWCFKFLSPYGLTMRLFKTFPISDGRWYHLAFTWDRQVGRLYCDGLLVTSMAFNAYMGFDPAQPWLVGAGENNSRLKGAVDELHFANDALTPDFFRNLQANYGIGKPGTGFYFPEIHQDGGPPSTHTPVIRIKIQKGLPLMPGLLYISTKPAWISLPGGLFLVDPNKAIAIPFSMNPGLNLQLGSAEAHILLPPPGPSAIGQQFFLQALIIDPGVINLISLTPGLVLNYSF